VLRWASAAGARIHVAAGRSQEASKKLLVITLAASPVASPAGGFRAPDALPVTRLCPLRFCLPAAGSGSAPALPPRPGPRRFRHGSAAIALPCPSWPKALLTSLEQTPSRPAVGGASRFAAARLIFGMACSTLGGPKGGHCSQKLLLRRGLHSSPGRSRSSDRYEINTLSQRSDARGPWPLRRSLFPRRGGAVVTPAGRHHRFL